MTNFLNAIQVLSQPSYGFVFIYTIEILQFPATYSLNPSSLTPGRGPGDTSVFLWCVLGEILGLLKIHLEV